MSKRRYTYSYSPTSWRERTQRLRTSERRSKLPSWLLLPVVIVVAVAAVLLHQWTAGEGQGSAAARSNCWTQVACSAERVEPAAQDSAAPDGETDSFDEPAVDNTLDDGDEDEPAPPVSAAAVAVIEEPCGALVHSVNAHARLSPASLTKIVTALVAVEQVNIAQTVYVNTDGGALSAATNATIMGLRPGQSMGMVDLLYGLLLPSGNDAAIEIAEQIAGSVEEFAVLMNAKVAALGLSDTQFANPHGLDEPGHFTSAYDIGLLGGELLKDPDLAAIVGTRSYQPNWDGPRVRNLNLLLGQYPGAIGVKTGYTEQAGQTLVAAAERDGRRFIVALLGSDEIYVDATALLDWAFASAPSLCAAGGSGHVAASR